MLTREEDQPELFEDDDAANWSFDDDELLSNEDDESPPVVRVKTTSEEPPAPPLSLYEELQLYLLELSSPSTLSVIHSLLQKHQTSPDELLSYYSSRPNLKEYTLKTELQRMSYTIKDGTETLTSPKLILERYSNIDQPPTHDILWRAANQSLLADFLQCLTGETKIIKPQYGTTAIATHCDFTLDFNLDLVQCQCTLRMNIPVHDTRVELADMKLQVVFSPHGPRLEMKAMELHPFPVTEENLLDMTSSLESHPLPLRKNNGPVVLRDAMVTSVLNTKTGMSSALKQVDAVVNVKSKLNFFKKLNFLPSADLLAAAEMEEEEYHVAETEEDVKLSSGYPSPAEDPKSQMIGGLLMNNLSKLANKPERELQEDVGIELYRRKEVPEQQQLPNTSPLFSNKEERPRRVSCEEGWSDDELELSDVDEGDLVGNWTPMKKEENTIMIVEEGDEDIVETRKRWRRPFRNRIRF